MVTQRYDNGRVTGQLWTSQMGRTVNKHSGIGLRLLRGSDTSLKRYSAQPQQLLCTLVASLACGGALILTSTTLAASSPILLSPPIKIFSS